MGSLASGKSALVHRYLTGSYMQEESPEGGRFKKEILVDNQSYLLLIRDEGGPPELQVYYLIMLHSYRSTTVIDILLALFLVFCNTLRKMRLKVVITTDEQDYCSVFSFSVIENIKQLHNSKPNLIKIQELAPKLQAIHSSKFQIMQTLNDRQIIKKQPNLLLFSSAALKDCIKLNEESISISLQQCKFYFQIQTKINVRPSIFKTNLAGKNIARIKPV